VCPPHPNAAPACTGGICGYTCNPGWGDCDGNPANGCESDLHTAARNCGACGTVCGASSACVNGACVGASASNDLCGGAIPLNLANPSVTVTGTTTGATSQVGCGGQDVYYAFSIPDREIIYADTFDSAFDTELAIVNGCPSLVTDFACNDDSACGGPDYLQSHVFAILNPGSYFIVVAGYSLNTGSFTMHFNHYPAGSGMPLPLSQGASLSVSNTTSGTGQVVPCNGFGTNAGEIAYYYETCPNYPGGTIDATFCTAPGAAAWDTELNFLQPTVPPECNDDSCGVQSHLNAPVTSGAGMRVLYVDGYNGQTGAYTLLYSVP
jgi:hypothetical protein